MDKIDIEIPADAKTVTLALKGRAGHAATLRDILPLIRGDVELVVSDEFDVVDALGRNIKGASFDLYKVKGKDGPDLLTKLQRSRVVEGEFLLDQVPSIQREDPTIGVFNGTFGVNTGTGCVQLWVKSPAPDKED